MLIYSHGHNQVVVGVSSNDNINKFNLFNSSISKRGEFANRGFGIVSNRS